MIHRWTAEPNYRTQDFWTGTKNNMPVWDCHYPARGLSQQQRQTLANNITRIYTNLGLPPFYVQVRFHEAAPSSFFVGGQDYSSTSSSSHKDAGIQIIHVARSFDSEESKTKFLHKVDQVLNPVFEGQGWDWEYWVMEGPRELWKINGIVPPPTGSETEKRWFEANKPFKGLTLEKL